MVGGEKQFSKKQICNVSDGKCCEESRWGEGVESVCYRWLWKAALQGNIQTEYLKEVREYSMRVIWERSIPGRVNIKYKALRQESIGELTWSKHKGESWEA